MNEILYHAATVVATILLLFSFAAPAQARNINPIKAESTSATKQGNILANQLPIINVWYEGSLHFGDLGNPQTQVNILGNVHDPDGSIASLTYRLNGSSSKSLTIGPDGARLENPGDFNVAIDISVLIDGINANKLVLTAKDNSGGTLSKTVTFSYRRGRTWPAVYSTNWAVASSIYDQAQIVDGWWDKNATGVRPHQTGYDRLIAIGDMGWSSYEVVVPITVHHFDSNSMGGVGIIARWQGHLGSKQPPSDWWQIGAYAYYSNRSDRRGLSLRLDQTDPYVKPFTLEYNKTYMFKLRAETVSQGGRYSFKVWAQGQPEPSWSQAQFLNVIDSTDTLDHGSVLLVAHHTDATFGDVSVTPYPLNLPYQSYLPLITR